ncbi:MAG: hypothetical protein DME33_05380 [Verrucomicrobia bacterium]|nr:MAG: hypothetical protein DME33_05380 [Verrucomicrobiota bacterium]
MPQVRRGLERTIVPSVIVFGDFDRVVGVLKYFQILLRFIIAVDQDKVPGICFSNQNLTETKWRSRRFETSLDGIWHW